MLARLDAIPGVSGTRVDSSGRHFWLSVDGAVDPAEVIALALEILGTGSRVLAPARAEAQLSEEQRGDPWLGAGEVMTLSFVEARLLSVRIAGDLQRLSGIGPEDREEVAEAIRAELFAAMQRVHSEGGRGSSGWIYEEWPAIAAAAVRRCAETVPGELRVRLDGLLPALLRRS